MGTTTLRHDIASSVGGHETDGVGTECLSGGLGQRLAFAWAVHVRSAIALVDDVLVGLEPKTIFSAAPWPRDIVSLLHGHRIPDKPLLSRYLKGRQHAVIGALQHSPERYDRYMPSSYYCYCLPVLPHRLASPALHARRRIQSLPAR